MRRFSDAKKVTARDNFPLSLIEDQLSLLAGKKYFTTLDLKDGFFHIRMHKDSIKYTSFVTPIGQYEYTRMPFGLKSASLMFQRYVARIFKEQIDAGEISGRFSNCDWNGGTSFSYIRENFQASRGQLFRIAVRQMSVPSDKIRLFRLYGPTKAFGQQLKVLEAIKTFPVPQNVRDVQSYLGLCSYFRKFVEDFSVIAKPLYDLTKKNVEFWFEGEEQRVFEVLKYLKY